MKNIFSFSSRLQEGKDRFYTYAAGSSDAAYDKFKVVSNSRVLGNVDPVVRASVAGAQPAPVAYITAISGTNELTSIDLPWQGFTGTVAFRPTGAFTGATGGTTTDSTGAIGKAFTAVASKILFMTFDGSLWYPSY